MTLYDRVAIVTGASRGIGKAIAFDLNTSGPEYNRVIGYKVKNMRQMIEKEKARLRKFIKID